MLPRSYPLVVASVAALCLSLATNDSRHTWRPWSAARLLDYMPATASLVVTADLAQLRGTPLEAVLPDGEQSIPGAGTLSSLCGEDPTPAIRVLGLALPGQQRPAVEADELGVVVGGDFDQPWLLECARHAIEQRRSRPRQKRIGRFVVLSAEPTQSGVLAIRDGGPVILGGAAFLTAMLESASQRRPSAASSEIHRSLRQELSPAAVLVTWQHPGPAGDSALGWLAEPGETPPVEAIGVALRVKPATRVVAILRCTSFEHCAEVAAALDRIARRLLGRLLGKARPPPLELTAARTEVRAELSLTENQLGLLLEVVMSVLRQG